MAETSEENEQQYDNAQRSGWEKERELSRSSWSASRSRSARNREKGRKEGKTGATIRDAAMLLAAPASQQIPTWSTTTRLPIPLFCTCFFPTLSRPPNKVEYVYETATNPSKKIDGWDLSSYFYTNDKAAQTWERKHKVGSRSKGSTLFLQRTNSQLNHQIRFYGEFQYIEPNNGHWHTTCRTGIIALIFKILWR